MIKAGSPRSHRQSRAAVPLRRSVLHQGIWGIANVAIIRVITFLAQVVLAAILAPREFGIYAVAMAASTIALTLRGAGVTQWLIEGGEERHSERGVDAFWLALAWNILLGGLVAGCARPIAMLMHTEGVATLVAFIGLSFPLQTLATYYFARLQIQLRIRDLTIIELVSAIIRGVLMIVGAVMGLGVYSFVIPIPVCYLVEGALGYLMVHEAPWRARPHWRGWGKILRSTGWVIGGTIGTAIGLQGDYVVLGAMAPIAAVGVYYFAYQLTLQTAGLVATNVNRVLTSALVAAGEANSARRFLRATDFILLVGSPAVLLLGSVIAPFEHIMWGPKWESAISPVVWLSAGLPLYLLATAVQSRQLSAGQFREWMHFNVAKAVAVVVTAFVAGSIGGGPARITGCMATGLAVAHIAQVVIGMRKSHTRVDELIAVSWIGVLVAPSAMLASFVIIQRVRWPDFVDLFAGPLLMLALYVGTVALLRPRLIRTSGQWLRFRLKH